jgi:hypothetical protein
MSDNFHELCILTIRSSIAVIVRTTVVLRFLEKKDIFGLKCNILCYNSLQYEMNA